MRVQRRNLGRRQCGGARASGSSGGSPRGQASARLSRTTVTGTLVPLAHSCPPQTLGSLVRCSRQSITDRFARLQCGRAGPSLARASARAVDAASHAPPARPGLRGSRIRGHMLPPPLSFRRRHAPPGPGGGGPAWGPPDAAPCEPLEARPPAPSGSARGQGTGRPDAFRRRATAPRQVAKRCWPLA